MSFSDSARGAMVPITRLDIDAREVVLTFDDGPTPYTAEMAAVLARAGVPATFFWRGDRVRPGEDRGVRLVRAGHRIGSHSVTHRHFPDLDDDEVRREMRRAGEIVGAAAGMAVRHFRPPYGEYDVRTLAAARECGTDVILWDVDTEDWRLADAPEQIVTAVGRARPGSIILMHERPQALKVLPDVIRRLRSAGFGFRLLPDPPVGR